MSVADWKPRSYNRVKLLEGEGISVERILKISKLSEEADCAIETIRYYEREGLLPEPVRTAGNYRIYSARHVERLRFIRHCRYLDMTLDEIRRLLRFCDAPRQSCHEVNELLDEHIGHVGQRIAELQKLEKRLRELRRLCRETSAAKDCGILQGLASSGGRSGNKGPRRSHVRGAHDRRHHQKSTV